MDNSLNAMTFDSSASLVMPINNYAALINNNYTAVPIDDGTDWIYDNLGLFRSKPSKVL